jgi:mRNA-degrading endonuclease toxin of MazEF toxin-antitoxin module
VSDHAGGEFAREHGFAVSLHAAGTLTQGVILCHPARVLDYKERGARFQEPLPEDLVAEVLARVRTLLD